MRKQKKKNKAKKIVLTVILLLLMIGIAVAIGIILGNRERNKSVSGEETAEQNSVKSVSASSEAVSAESEESAQSSSEPVAESVTASSEPVTESLSTESTSMEGLPEELPSPEPAPEPVLDPRTEIGWNEGWDFASYSQIHSSPVVLYRAMGANRRNIVVGLNAGHGTSGGDSYRTQCHPDGSPKVTGGSTAAGSTTATAIASGMTFLDGTPERDVTLQLALFTRDLLLEDGFDVLMIRELSDTQLDNIARTVFCNNNAQCHIAVHFDSTDYDKGLYAMTVPNVDSYRSMYPVSEMWPRHNQLAECLVNGAAEVGVKVWGERTMGMDLTQTSYSTVPSVDIEMGDRATNHSDENLMLMAQGLVRGVEIFFSAS